MSNNQSDDTVSSTADGAAAANPVVTIKIARKGLPDFLQSVNLKYVKLGYHYLMSHFLTLCLVPLIGITLVQASQMNYQDFQNLYLHLQLNLISVIVVSAFIVCGSTAYIMSRPRSIYLVDYACYRPPDHLKVKYKKFMDHSRLTGDFDESSLEFQRKILERSGLGEETYLPEAMHCIPPRPSMATAREEAEQVMFGALDNLFKSTNIKPKDIGILVVNCSLFNPTPSLSAMIVNKYKLRGNIKSFNLGGMGCSAGVIAIDLAKDMLQVHRNTYAVVVSTENITQNWYFGNKKSMLIPNCLFRVGCAATLLSNKASERRRAKYKLVHVVRTHKGAEDTAFNCVYQEQDDKGKTGVSLSKDLMAIAGGALIQRFDLMAIGVSLSKRLKPIVHGVMKLAGVTPQKVEIEPGTVMNFWVPTETINNENQRLINKPPVMLLHGFFANGILTWLFQVLALTRNYAVYVPDLLFFGDSVTDKPERSTSFQAECLAKGLTKLGVESCTVVGLSYGGMVAFKLAKLYPDLVKSVVVSGTVPELTQSISDATLEKLGFSRWSDLLMPETVDGLKRLLSIGSHTSLFTRFPRFVYGDFLEVMFNYRKEKAELLEALVVPDHEFTPTFSQRIYLLWGNEDKIFNLEVAHNMKLHWKDMASLYCIENAGHISQLERPGIYSNHLKTILGSLHV